MRRIGVQLTVPVRLASFIHGLVTLLSLRAPKAVPPVQLKTLGWGIRQMSNRGQVFPVLLGPFTLKLAILGCVPRLSLLYSGGLGGCAVDSVALWRAGAGSSIGRTLDVLEARNGECVGQCSEPGSVIGGNHLWLWSLPARTLHWVTGPQVPSLCGVGDGLVIGTQVAYLIPARWLQLLLELFAPLVPYWL